MLARILAHRATTTAVAASRRGTALVSSSSNLMWRSSLGTVRQTRTAAASSSSLESFERRFSSWDFEKKRLEGRRIELQRHALITEGSVRPSSVTSYRSQRFHSSSSTSSAGEALDSSSSSNGSGSSGSSRNDTSSKKNWRWLLFGGSGTLLAFGLFQKKKNDEQSDEDNPLDTSNPLHFDETPILKAIISNPLEADIGDDVPLGTSDMVLIDMHRQKYGLFTRAVRSFMGALASSVELGFMVIRVVDLWVRFTPLMTLMTLRLLHLIPRSSLPAGAPVPVDENGEPDYDADWWAALPLRVLLYTLESCGPCFIKLGQWAATRPDLFPEAMCYHLSKLHTGCPTHPFSHTKEVIEGLTDANGKSVKLEDVFETFDREPLASGAIAQVHRAKLKSGDFVAVKVRHPNVVEDIVRDLKILKTVAAVLTTVLRLESMSLDEAVDQFSITMRMQVDLRREALNLIRFGKNFADLTAIRFPKAFVPLCTTPALLVESFEEGNPISLYLPSHHHHQHHIASAERIASLTDQNSSQPQFSSAKVRKTLASLGTRMFLKMLILDNFIHADLHPGNILVREEFSRNGHRNIRIIVLDVGLVCELSPIDRQNFLALFSAVAAGDSKKGAELMATRARGHLRQTPEQLDYFKEEMNKILTEATSRPIAEIEVGKVLSAILSVCRKCNVKIESNYATMVVGIIVVEGLARQLNAEFNLLEEARPMLKQDAQFVKSYVKTKLSKKFNKKKAEA